MPRSLMLRALPSELVGRITAYARTHELPLPRAAAQLLTIALDHLDARAAGGRASHDGRSAEERSESGRHAARARWAARDTE